MRFHFTVIKLAKVALSHLRRNIFYWSYETVETSKLTMHSGKAGMTCAESGKWSIYKAYLSRTFILPTTTTTTKRFRCWSWSFLFSRFFYNIARIIAKCGKSYYRWNSQSSVSEVLTTDCSYSNVPKAIP